MKSPLITLITGSLLSVPAWAFAPHFRGPHRPHGDGCAEMKLSDAQKTQLREARLSFEGDRIDLQSKERHARLDLEKQLFAKDANPAAIRKAAQAAADASAKLRTAEAMQQIDVLLKVFKPEQRGEAMRCAHDFGPGFGPGPRHPGDEPLPPPREPAAAPGEEDAG